MRILHPLHETIDHLLFEGDGELVAADLHHLAVAEFLMKYAAASAFTPPGRRERETRQVQPHPCGCDVVLHRDLLAFRVLFSENFAS
jgi:hypothetical protein